MSRITAFLMTEKGFLFLKEAFEHGFDSIFQQVVVGKDKAVQKDYADDIIQLCQKSKVPVYERNQKEVLSLSSPLGLAIGWRWLIPEAQFPNIIVFHDSLLPKYRGFAPTVNALINGEQEIGTTALWATTDYDEGPIIAQEKIRIEYPITIQKAIELQACLYTKLGVNILRDLAQGKALNAIEQDHEKASFSIWRDEQDYQLDWSMDAARLERTVHALGFPYSGAQSFVEGFGWVRIWDAKASYDYHHEIIHPGKVFKKENDGLWVICGKGSLKLLEVTLEEDGSPFQPKAFRLRFK